MNRSLKELLDIAVGLHQRGRIAAASLQYEEILRSCPEHFDSLHLLGIACAQMGDAPRALKLFESAVRLNPASYSAHYNRGNLLKDLKCFEEAIKAYDTAIALKPDYAQAISNRANALQEVGRLDEALTSYDCALNIQPTCADTHCNRGNTLLKLKRPLDALDCFDRSIALNPAHAEALNSRGNALKDLRRFGEAVMSYDAAIAHNESYAEAFSNRGHALHELARTDEALQSYNRALTIRPDFAEAQWNKSLLLLLTQNFGEGWPLYEWRWKGSRLSQSERPFKQPLWLGAEDLSEKTILLHAEQGLGDTIQFCRYAAHVSRLNAKVILEVQEPLGHLLENLSGVGHLIRRGDELPHFDFHCPLLSLPLAFHVRKTEIKSHIPYLFAQPDRVLHWANQIGTAGFRVGICWQGKASSKSDAGRSFPLREFAVLSALPDLRLISLHKGDGEHQLQNLPPGMRVEVLGPSLDADGAFLDTAAVMMNLDLVITSDTAVAHLAGALGIPVWVVLKSVPDWRWMLERNDSPWYPSMRLFRQQREGEWGGVFNLIASELQELISLEALKRNPGCKTLPG